MSGWIALHRGWMENPIFDSAQPLSDREAWLWLIERAAWKDCGRRGPKGERITIKRGQYHSSLRTLGSEWKWGKNKVSRFLERLESEKMIGTVAGQSGLLVTICNYDKYQSVVEGDGTESGTVAGQSRDTQEQRKQGKQENHHQAASAKNDAGEPDFDLAQLMSRCCDAAGMPTPDPMREFAKHSKALAAVQGWRDAGIGEAAMLAKIGEVRRRAPSQIQSLGYFDGAVREVAKAAMPTQHSDALAMAQRILAEKRRAA